MNYINTRKRKFRKATFKTLLSFTLPVSFFFSIMWSELEGWGAFVCCCLLQAAVSHGLVALHSAADVHRSCELCVSASLTSLVKGCRRFPSTSVLKLSLRLLKHPRDRWQVNMKISLSFFLVWSLLRFITHHALIRPALNSANTLNKIFSRCPFYQPKFPDQLPIKNHSAPESTVAWNLFVPP